MVLDCDPAVVMRVAGSNTDNTVPTIAPIPTPTINNRKAYKIVLAMGFSRVSRERLVFFGTACFRIRTFLNLTALGLTDEFLLTALGLKGGIFPLSVAIGFITGPTTPGLLIGVAVIGGGLSLLEGRPCSLVELA